MHHARYHAQRRTSKCLQCAMSRRCTLAACLLALPLASAHMSLIVPGPARNAIDRLLPTFKK